MTWTFDHTNLFVWIFVSVTALNLVLVAIFAFRPKRKKPIDFMDELYKKHNATENKND